MPVELVNPRGLWLLALLGPLVVLYLLKVRRKRVVVPAAHLWKVAQRDLMARNPLRRFRREIALLLQAGALIILAVSLADPHARTQIAAAEHVAFVIDTSASMGAAEGGITRLEAARQKARAIARSLRAEADALIIDAAREPRLAVPLDRDKRRLERGISALSVRHEEGRLAASVALAFERLERLAGAKRVVVITDDPLAAELEAARTAVPTEILVVGKEADNAGVVRFDVRRAQDPVTGKVRVDAFAAIENFGRKAVDRFVTLRQRNTTGVLASRRVRIAPAERAPVLLSFEPAGTDAGTGIVLELDPADTLESDDRAYGIVPFGQDLVAVFSPEGRSQWLARALSADSGVEVRFAPLAEALDDRLIADLLVLTGACPPRIPSTDFVVVAPPEGTCLGATVGPKLEAPVITSWAEEDPRFRFVEMDDVHLSTSRSLRGLQPSTTLVRAGDAVLGASLDLFGTRGTLLAFDAGASDWPLKASFVVFARNLTELSRISRAQRGGSMVASGELLRIRVPASVSRIELSTPDGGSRAVETRDGFAIVSPPSTTGFYFASWKDDPAGSALFAVNLTSLVESDLKARPAAKGLESVAKSAPSSTTRVGSLVFLFAIVALAFVLTDVWYSTRKPRPAGSLGGAVGHDGGKHPA